MAEFVVTTISDSGADGAVSGNLPAEQMDGGGLSLREAILLANASVGADTISFDESVFAAGATVLLSQGELTITEALTIAGDADGDGDADVTIDAQGASRVLRVSGDGTTTLNDLVITGGAVNGFGGGVFAGADMVLNGTSVTGNATTGYGLGGGIFTNKGLTLNDSAVSSNSTTGDNARGGGVWVGGQFNLTDSSITGNSTAGLNADGGGVYAIRSFNAVNSTVSYNSTSANDAKGGGVYLYQTIGTITLTDSVVHNNSTAGINARGGGIYTRGVLTVEGSTIRDNVTSGERADGAGIAATNTSTITDSVFSGNTAQGPVASGGGIYAIADTVVTDSTFSGNSSTERGGGIDVDAEARLTLTNSEITGNTAFFGGGISADSAIIDAARIHDNTAISGLIVSGGGARLGSAAGGSVTITNSHIYNNTLETTAPSEQILAGGRGAGINLDGGPVLIVDTKITGNKIYGPYMNGAGIGQSANTDDAMTILNSEISGNEIHANISDGAGIFGYKVYLTDSIVSNNKIIGSEGEGAGIDMASARDSLLVMSRTVVSGNQIHASDAIFGAFETYLGSRGGAGLSTAGNVIITDSEFSHNTLSGDTSGGSAIHQWDLFDKTQTFTIRNSSFFGNSSDDDIGTRFGLSTGSAIRSEGVSLELINSTVTGNYDTGAGGGGLALGASSNTITNSIVYGNFGDGGRDDLDGSAYATSTILGQTLIGLSGSTSAVSAAQVFQTVSETVPGSGVFAGVAGDNGGPVRTVMLRADASNPALDIGLDGSAGTANDGRGTSRTVDLPGISNAAGYTVDLGAVELQSLNFGSSSGPFQVTQMLDELDFNGPDATLASMGGALDLSLREAIHLANLAPGQDTITFGPAGIPSDGVLDLTLGQLEITDDLIIQGPSGQRLLLDAGGMGRILDVTGSDTDLTLSHLTLTGGHVSDGRGGAIRTDGNLTLISSAVTDSMTSGNGDHGGGIFAFGDVILASSTVANNATTGANSKGGGIFGFGTVLLNAATVSGNSTASVSGHGGGVWGVGTIIAVQSTISGNSTAGNRSEGGGLFSDGGRGGGIYLANSIVTGNVTGYTGVGADQLFQRTVLGGTISYGGANIVGNDLFDQSADIGDVAIGDVFQATSQINDGNGAPTGVLAGVLANNGGPVDTIALRDTFTNPALDRGDDSVFGTAALLTGELADARGAARPFDIPGFANDGSNVVDLGAFESQVPYLTTPGNDTITGSAADETINAGAGDDTVDGKGGANILRGQGGEDDLSAAGGADTLAGGTDNDTLAGGGGEDDLLGQGGADRLLGQGGNDTITGGTGADSAFGGTGDDQILGQGDADRLEGGGGFDSIAGGSGNDVLYGGDDDDQLYGGGNNDLLFGGAGNDFLRGAAGQDSLFGGSGDDTLFGGASRDTLDGGTGNDLLNAGAGVDIFIFGAGAGNDTIVGFGDDQDTLELALTLFDPATYPVGPTAQQILDDFAMEVGASVEFMFAGGEELRITNITEAQLLNDIDVV